MQSYDIIALNVLQDYQERESHVFHHLRSDIYLAIHLEWYLLDLEYLYMLFHIHALIFLNFTPPCEDNS